MKLLLTALLLLTSAARAELGVSYLAFAGFNNRECTKALRVWRGLDVAWVSFLWGSFGDGPCPERFLGLPNKRKRVQIYASNGTCKRKPRHCTRWDQPRSYERRIETIAAWILLHRKGKVRFRVVIELEDDLLTHEYLRRVRIAKRVLPRGVMIGRNPNAKHFDSTNVRFIELHGLERDDFPRAVRGIGGSDGYDVDFHSRRRPCRSAITMRRLSSAIARAKANGRDFLAWYNAQGACTGKFVEPHRRVIRIFPEDVYRLNAILRSRS